jgi:hypothetical protein
MRHRNSILDSILVLALLGFLAGAVGGYGIGLLSKSTSSASSSAAR